MFLAILLLLISIVILTFLFCKNRFKYPYFTHRFDVSNKRNVKIQDYLDNFLCNEANRRLLNMHEKRIREWKRESEQYIRKCKFKNLRLRQYEAVLDDNHAYRFETVRKQTRYQQRNYIKSSYSVMVSDRFYSTSWTWLVDRYKKLKHINFETTLNNYNNNNQRKLLTPSLRKQIMERDQYTCKICGKYMPDEVGLHIDHIVPIAKGGKSVVSNLQVLCSKCNGRKGSK